MTDEMKSVELPALNCLKSLGWQHIQGADIDSANGEERPSLKDVVLTARLSDAVRKINPNISDFNLDTVIKNLTKERYTNLIDANYKIWTDITQHAIVMQNIENKNRHYTVNIIDFDNPEKNDFLCVNQFKVASGGKFIIPDIVLFVNGLPLAVIECKSPYITNPMEQGIEQLLRYANQRNPDLNEGAVKLFHYNQIMVSTYGDKARMGTITSSMEGFLEWKDPYPKTLEEIGDPNCSQNTLIAGLFSKVNFLDIIQNFTVFETTGGYPKKRIARYQQFRAVHKTIGRLKSGNIPKEKSGVIWHTQGSGKSLTMVFLSIKIRRDPELQKYKLVFLTDRKQLEAQLTSTLRHMQKETVHSAYSVKKFKEFLSTDSSDIVMGMIQKFQSGNGAPVFPIINESEKIIIFVDEAHRSQYGTLAAAMDIALPNAIRIAFTGTPLMKSQKTASVFGTYIDMYTIEQSVQDGCTVKITYEGRQPELTVTANHIDQMFEEYFASNTDDEKTKIKTKYGTQQAILEAPDRIQKICVDIMSHYCGSILPNGFKAMIVTSSRRAAILYKEQLDQLPNSQESAVIISSNRNDSLEYEKYTNPIIHKQKIDQFKKPYGDQVGQSKLSFLIVTDMLLTGFDAPIAQVMYLDKKITDHSLLQAIARVNRISKNKSRGYIVDYYGLKDYLDHALSQFSPDDIKGALINIEEEMLQLKHLHSRVLGNFEGINLNDLEECVLLLKDDLKRQTFNKDFRDFSRQMDIVLPNRIAAPFLTDIKNLGKISIRAGNLYRDEQLNISGAGEKIRSIICDHIKAIGITPRIEPIELLAADYEKKLKEHESTKTMALEIEQAIRYCIKTDFDGDIESAKKFSEMLDSIIKQAEENWDEMVQQLLDLKIKIKAKFDENEAQSLICDIIYSTLREEILVDENLNQKVRQISQSIKQTLDEVVQIVDFWDKWDEQRRIRLNIKRLIIHLFDEAEVTPIIEKFMELAKTRIKNS